MIFAVLAVISVEAAVAAASDKIFVFHGKIQAIDATGNAFTLQTNKGTYVFSITDQTKVTKMGRQVKLDRIRVGEETDVSMKIGPGGKDIAVSIDLGSVASVIYSEVQSLCGGVDPNGKRLSGIEVMRLVAYKPEFEAINRAIDFGPLRRGFFLLSVRPDGTVSNVEMLRSTGHRELDERTTKYLMKWRFQPNRVAQVRVPAEFQKYYPY